MPFNLSFVLILSVWTLALSPSSLLANESPTEKLSSKNKLSSPPTRQEQQQTPNPHKKESSQPSPAVTQSGPVGEPSANPQKHGPNNQAKNTHEWEREESWYWGTVPDWALVIVGIATAIAALLTLRVIKCQIEISEKAADAAKDAAIASIKQADSIITSERAYVKISHHPPGLKQDSDSSQYSIHLRVKNFGQTPATITKIFIRDEIVAANKRLPEVPNYTTSNRCTNKESCIFLVREDEFSFFHTIPILENELQEIRRRVQTFYVYGYVDYIDQFGIRHRAGYGRQLIMFGNGNNLDYILRPGYNYDRPRDKDEGSDWNIHL